MSELLKLQPRNDKSMRLRYLRDRLHLTGQHMPSVKLAVEILVEILGTIRSPRYLTYVKRETAKLRERTPDPTAEELQFLSFLDDRITRRGEQIRSRLEKKNASKKGKPKQLAPIAAPGENDVWDL